MATGTQVLTTLRAALGASEGATTTPTRLLYPGLPENVDLSGIQQFTTIEDRVAWAKRDQVRALYNGVEDNTVALSNVPASFEDLGFYLSTIPGIISGAGSAAGTPTTTDTSAYTRVFLPSQTVTAYGATGGYDMHLQVGEADLISTVGWSIPGLRCTDFTLNMKKRASGTDTGLTFSGTWQTPKTATQITAFTGSLSDRTQTLPTGNVGKTWLDTTTSGSTADPAITEATFHVGNPPSWHDGLDATSLHTSMHFAQPMSSDLTITRKFGDTTELATYLARTTRKFRFKAEGALIGAVSALNTIQLDFIGQIVTHQRTWVDGILYATINLMGIYDATLLASYKFTTISTVSAAYTTA